MTTQQTITSYKFTELIIFNLNRFDSNASESESDSGDSAASGGGEKKKKEKKPKKAKTVVMNYLTAVFGDSFQ